MLLYPLHGTSDWKGTDAFRRAEETKRYTGLCRTCLTNWSVRINKDRLRAGYDSLYSGVEMQLDILGSFHVGYDQNSFTAAGGVPFAIVGGRPFSKVPLTPLVVLIPIMSASKYHQCGLHHTLAQQCTQLIMTGLYE